MSNAPMTHAAGPAPVAPAATRVARAVLSEYSVLFLSIVYFLAVWPFVPELGSGENLSNLFSSMLPLLAVAIGQTVVLITGGIDLSATAVIGLASVAGAWVMNGTSGLLAGSPLAVPAGVGLMLLVGLTVGLLNGLAITAFDMPPFIVTLTMMMLAGGVAVYSTQSRNIIDLPDAFVALASGSSFRVPYAVLLVGALAVIAHGMLSRTLVGRWLYAVGMNARASLVSGVPVKRVIVFAYCVSGVCAAVASMLYTARLETGKPTIADRILLDVVGAAVIGGTSLFGGKGKVIWTAFGVLLFTLIDNTLNMLSLQHYTITMVKGGVILLAAMVDLVRNRVLAGS